MLSTYISVFLFCILLMGCSSNYPIYLGEERTGYAISIERAIENARPYLFDSFKLRNPSSSLTEKEYFEAEHYEVFVYLNDGQYLIFRDTPKKMPSQHMASPVSVNLFSGAVSEPK